MIKKLMLTLCAAALTGSAVQAQDGSKCATDDFHAAQKAIYPQIAIEEAKLRKDIDLYMTGRLAAGHNHSHGAKGASLEEDALKPWPEDVVQYHIPVVVHLIFDNTGTTAGITDNDIYGMISRLNLYYNQADPALAQIITPWKKYIGNAHITFHLANKDPQGKPTRGITKTFSYATNGGDEVAKIGQWPPNQYLNIYLENYIGRAADKGIVLAYATFPTDYSSNPYSQGVISRADQATATGGNSYTLAHEIGHFLYLHHPWANNGRPVEDTICGDDEVDDTPPTIGHFSCGFSKLYDTLCAKGYYKDYDSATYYHMTGESIPVVLAANTVLDTTASVSFNDTIVNSLVGQSFTTTSRVATLSSITVRVDTVTKTGGPLSMSLYNANGTILIAKSQNTQVATTGNNLTFSFFGVDLGLNTTYKFVIDSGSSSRFTLYTSNANSYAGGALYVGTKANTVSNGNDLYFIVNQIHRINYPDTTNTQNVMDYSGCNEQMFTKGQVARMRGALRSEVGNRKELISDANLVRTGVMDNAGNILPATDLTPVALFTVTRPFTCKGSTSPITFQSRSYGDTIENANWTFDKNASNPTSNSINAVSNTFDDTGWVTVSLNVTGNNTGTSPTVTRNDVVYVADPTGITPYVEDFNPSNMLGRFPIFNYFKRPDYGWEVYNNAGFYDKTSMRFKNYDRRDQGSVNSGIAVNTATESPRGFYADFYTPAYDLSGFGGNCFLDFYSAGAYRTTKTSYMNDTLLVSYSTNCGVSWNTLGRITRGDLATAGYVAEAFEPGWFGHWKEQSLPINSSIRTNQVYFRFRYFPGTDNAYFRYNGLDWGTGNHFYLDRLTVTDAPLSVKNGVIVNLGMSVSPNPTSGAATIRLNGGDNSTAEVSVTDVTGKVVYRTSAVRKTTSTEIEIPATALTVKGMYMVQVVTNGATETQKLVVY